MTDDKRSECVKVYVSEPLELELRRLADAEDRKLSDYIAIVLRRHVFGHVAPSADDAQGPNRATSGLRS
jgi:hypothetical protein